MIDSSIDKTNMHKSITEFSVHIKESFDFLKDIRFKKLKINLKILNPSSSLTPSLSAPGARARGAEGGRPPGAGEADPPEVDAARHRRQALRPGRGPAGHLGELERDA